MARQKGMLNLSGNLEPLAGAPLDSRDVTPTVADLYIASNWPYKYIGMKTTVIATGETYRLVNLDVTQESSWVKEGGESGASNLSDLEDVDLINPEEGEALIYDGEGGWTNGPAGQTYLDFIGATAQAAGSHGLVPAPTTGDISKFLKGDGTWATVPIPSFDYSNTSPEAMNFSTDEKVIGTWIDGKPLYQKTVNCGALPNNTTKEIAHGISNIDKVINIKGIAINASANTYLNIPTITINQSLVNYQIGMDVNNTYVRILTGIDRSSYSAYVTLQYTKTTDTAVASGEKIVGQWIDGKPLYQKTVSTGALPNATTKTVAHDISNVDIIYVTSGIAYSNNKNLMVTIPNAHPLGVDKTIHASANRTDVVIATGTDRSELSNSYVTLQYTKSS